MATLNIASKANQAITFPPLMVASLINHSDSMSQISIHFDDVDLLEPGGKEAVGLSLSSNEFIYGEQVLDKMVDSFTAIQIKNQDQVQIRVLNT